MFVIMPHKSEKRGYRRIPVAGKDNKPSKITCPCCRQKRDVKSQTPLLQNKLTLRNLLSWWNPSEEVDEIVLKLEIQWACNFCLANEAAIQGNLHEQTFCDFPPYLAYFDVELHCEDCENNFIFFAAEQKFWYETLKFWVQSRPKQCVDCRRKKWAEKQKQRELQKLFDSKKKSDSIK